VLPRFIAAAQKNAPLRVFGDGEQRRCFCYVDDTVEALLRLVRAPATAGNIFNVGSTTEITIKELAELVVSILGSRSSLEFIPYGEAYEAGFDDLRRRKPDIGKLFKFTGFKPATGLQEIVQRTASSTGSRA
jgi:UDP-glucose 4-epimerase